MNAILENRKPLGLYVHIPFCHSICYYCDFCHRLYDEEIADRYLEMLSREMDVLADKPFTTAYVGGGTPSCLNEEQLERLLKKLSHFLPLQELTVEINPESFSREKARLFSMYGVNRISMGLQSFDAGRLLEMNRHHRPEDIDRCLEYLDDAGITNRSVDLIYGFRNQKPEDVIEEIRKAAALPVTHISIYELEVHDRTVFGQQNYPQPDDEVTAAMYEQIICYLTECGFEHYEVSNFARPGCQSVHNLIYWHYDDYYGIGMSASGKVGSRRYTNTSSMKEYLQGNIVADEVILDEKDLEFETIMMGLRLREGIERKTFRGRFGVEIAERYEEAIEKNIRAGLLELTDTHLRVTERGLFYLHDVLIDFME
ncbi:MAG: radical SAM family heme chaperone HemW [Erysipelotrichaceae bacterium]|nr:radical SAM family heme chaperone HemW [Erysipelotrichaceae bacterium]